MSSATKDRLSAENEEFKKKHKSLSDEKEAVTQQLTEFEMRMKVLNSQCEGKVTRLEKELQDYKTANDTKEKAIEELKTKEEKEKMERERIQGDEKLMQETKGFSDQQKSETLYKEIPQEKREKLLEWANTSGQETKLLTRLALTKELEARRLQWIKEHTPWR